jgi:hypothetical protein
MSLFTSPLHDPEHEQAWKKNHRLANKNGSCHSIYWAREKKETDILKRDPLGNKLWQTGQVYKGEWKNNKKHGYGIQVWSNGNKYEGDWANGLREGHGVFWLKKGGKLRKAYAGNWARGHKDGLGVQFYEDKGRYEGNWVNGMRQGRGTLFFENADVYVGDWNEDMRSGFGTLTRANEDVYEGEWLSDKREGAGIYYYKSKEKIYDGEWVNDQPKCGVYTAAKEFFDDDADFITGGEGGLNQRRRQIPIPELRLANPDELLGERIETIQRERQAVRNLPFIELEKLFSEEGLDDLRRTFAMADAGGTGKLAPSELQMLFRELGFSVTDGELASLLVDLNKKATDKLNFSDFVKAAHLIDELKAAQNVPELPEEDQEF